jgi:tRNA (adenine22-N1)-methyltransferase
VPEGARSVADVGAGDGQLARYLAARGLRVIATERSAGSFQRLVAASPGLDCRIGEGLSVLDPEEVEGVVLAGMGGRTIAGILSSSPAVAGALGWLLLQPQQRAPELATWLRGARYRTLSADEAVEGPRSYPVLLVRPPE